MPEIPEEAVQAAAEVLERREFTNKTFTGYARAAVEAAAPLIAEQARREERERIVVWLRERAELFRDARSTNVAWRAVLLAAEQIEADGTHVHSREVALDAR